MSEPKGLKLGEPIWVESLMSPDEYRKAHLLYPNTVLTSIPSSYIEKNYQGGKWRA